MKMASILEFKKTIKIVFAACLIFVAATSRSQSLSSANSWSKVMTGNKSFIENKGQFTLDGSDRKEVLFSVDHSNLKIFFTKKGIVYQLVKEKRKSEKEHEREEEFEEAMKRGIKNAEEFKAFEAEEHKIKTINETVNMLWSDANPEVEVIGADPKNDYHSYNYIQAGGTLKNINYIKGFGKIIYKNIYPFIDIEYTFAEKGGLKYSVILHPGANASQIKMVYDKHVDLKRNGDIHIDTKFGDIIDHAPLTFYEENNSNVVASNFIKDGKTVSFFVGSYDVSKTLVIDPWTQAPGFVSNWDCVWECDKDGAGNVYIIGGVNKMQLLKYNAAGALQWTYNTPYDTTAWLGTFATDNAGNSYVTQGSTAAIQKVNTAGALVWNNGSPSSQVSAEFWNITFNCDQTRLVVGGTGGSIPPVPYIYQIDVNTGNVVNSLQVTPGNLFPTQEVRSICASGNGKYYFLTHDSVGYINQNFSICGPNSSAMKKANSSYALSYKCENFRYNNSGIAAIRSSGTFFYTHRGDRIDKRSLTTLAIISTAPIPGGVFSGSAVQNSGIDIDACGNIYVGSKNQVVKYDANLTQLAVYPTSSTFNVYDVHVSTGGDIIACGTNGTSSTASRQGYIQSIAAGACTTMSLICCDPSICIPPKKCVTDPPFTFTVSTPGGTWSGPGVNASGVFTPSSVGVGTYTVVYSLACGSESVVVTVSSCTLSICQNSGSLVVSGGTPTYTWTSLTTSLSCAACAFGCNFLCPGTQVPVWSTTGSTITAPTGTVFPIKVTDAGGTTYTISNLASVPSCSTSCPTLTAAVASQTNVNCFGANTGTASITTVGGLGPYTYTWTPGNLIGASQSALTAGIYTVNVKDANNCPGTVTLSITQPTSAVSVSVTNTASQTCVQNGSATVNAFGGTSGYTYTWSPSGGNASSATGLVGGSYTVSVTDSKGCLTNTVVTINQNTVAPNISATVGGSLTCIATSVTLIEGSTTAGVTFTWQPMNLSTSTVSVTTVGNYSLTVTNPANGCTSTTVVAVTQNTVVPNISTSGPATLTCTNPSVVISGASTTGGATYSWMPGNITTSSISATATGNYSLTVTDPANGCTSTTVVAVTQNTVVPNVTAVGAGTITCSNPSLTLTGNSLTPGVTFTWQPMNVNTSTASATASGNYTVNVTNPVNGCTNTAVVAVTQNTVLPNVSATVGGTLTCSNNTVTLSGASITPGATFTWQPVNLNTANISVSATGNFTFSVTNPVNGCVSSTVVAVTQNGAFPNISIATPGTLTCINPSLTLTGNSTTSGVTYSWSPQNVTTNTAAVTAPGSYTLSVFDALNGCTSFSIVSVTQSANLPAVSIVKSNDINCTTTNATLTATSAGNTMVWNGGSLVNAANPVVVNVAGTYTVTATDPISGCTNTAVVNVTQSASVPDASVVSSGNLDCNNTVVTLTGSTTSSGVTMQWTGGPAASVYTVSTPGTYTFVVSDPVSGCSTFTTVTVNSFASFTVNLTSTPINCGGDNNGAIQVNLVGGGASPFTITNINSSTTTSNVAAFPFVINGLAAANYSISVMDASGCTQTLTINLTEPPVLTATAVGGAGVCEGAQLTISSNVQGGTPGYNYLWLPGGGNNSSITITPAVSTIYTLQITDANGCKATSTLQITVQPNPQGGIISQNVIGCAPACNTFSLAQAQFTTNSYQWNFTNNTTGAITSYNGYNPNVCFNVPGTYNLSLDIYSSLGCSVTASYVNVMTVYPKPVADFNHAPIKPIINQDPYVTFTDASYGANIISWNWFFMNTAQYTSTQQNPTFPYTEPGTYPVVLIVKSDKGCIDTIIRPLVVGEDFGIYVPNAFTPNEDGFNDTFFAKGFGIVKYELTVFDRWGEKVFSTTEFTQAWDGTFQGRGTKICKEDVYTWLIQATSVFGKSHELRGHVTLIR